MSRQCLTAAAIAAACVAIAAWLLRTARRARGASRRSDFILAEHNERYAG